jgi:hypothetical protein
MKASNGDDDSGELTSPQNVSIKKKRIEKGKGEESGKKPEQFRSYLFDLCNAFCC